MTSEQLHDRARDELQGHDLVDDLLAGRREEAAADDAS
jgi:hypothetical protein